ncbi:MAG: histidine--tRNA ligase [Phycisphaerales bacterium]
MPADENTNPAPARAPGLSRTPDPARYGQAPRGTRDFYPLEMAKRRWIEERWRRVATRFGFEEIDGPRFEHLDTYTVKSGEGIVNELFSFTRAGGDTEFALRPEFTPTLARMVAAKANALPKPIKWFSVGPYFRAERPQRGRLREFLQWNVDMVGDPSPEADAEVIACCVEMLRECGLTENDVRFKINHREAAAAWLRAHGVPEGRMFDAFAVLDRRAKGPDSEFESFFRQFGITATDIELLTSGIREDIIELPPGTFEFRKKDGSVVTREATGARIRRKQVLETLIPLWQVLHKHGCKEWVSFDFNIVRGLAYYTGTVFEVHEATGAERAIAGGGRYDNLVELFGGPSTPAVGFAMGDVVLSLVLQDKGLMPSDADIAKELRLNPDVYVFSVEESLDAHASAFLARCRREGLHARRSYKTTRNVGKLLKDASNQRARVAVFLEAHGDAFRFQVKDLSGGPQQQDFANADDALRFVHELL